MKLSHTFSVVTILGAVALMAPNANALTLLDTFTDAQSISQNGMGSNTGSIVAAGALGGYRRMVVNHTTGADTVKAQVIPGIQTLAYSSDFANDGNVDLQYDATPGNTFNPAGPSIVDLSGEKFLQGLVAGDLNNGVLTLKLYSSATDYSVGSINIVGSGSGSTFLPFMLDFSTLTATGAGVDLANVTAIDLNFGGSNSYDGGLKLLQFNNVPEPGNVAFAITGGMTALGLLRRRRSSK